MCSINDKFINLVNSNTNKKVADTAPDTCLDAINETTIYKQRNLAKAKSYDDYFKSFLYNK